VLNIIAHQVARRLTAITVIQQVRLLAGNPNGARSPREGAPVGSAG
jgi:hypothetical protein